MGKRIITFVTTLLLIISCSVISFAYENVGSLTITTNYENMIFKIYKVANMQGTNFVLTDSFKKYPVNIDIKTTEEQLTLASTLESYVVVDEINETQIKLTGANGNVTFDSLEFGLYLIMSEPIIIEDVSYYYAPYVISIPNQFDGKLVYNVISNPKPDILETQLYDQVSVVKLWNGEIKAESITVDLYCDGKWFDSKVLTATDGWRYTWTNLPYDHQWQVIEKDVPNDYTVTYQNNEINHIIENTYTTPKDPNYPEEDKIPQTGQLWWPVPILAVVGLFSLIYGWYKKNEE